MEDELNKALKRIRNKPLFKFQKVEELSEAQITSIILGVLYHYGWDIFDPHEVAHQFKTSSHGKVDVALINKMKVRAFVEIKNCKVDLNGSKPLNQIKEYLNDEDGVEMGILTNAVSWIFFKRDSDSENSIIKVAELDVKNVNDSEIKQVLSKYLSKENVVTPN